MAQIVPQIILLVQQSRVNNHFRVELGSTTQLAEKISLMRRNDSERAGAGWKASCAVSVGTVLID